MSDAIIGEIRFFPYARYAPQGWYECNGRQLSIREFTALFATIGITYGGDGETYFCVPDLRGHATVESGQRPGLSNYAIGKQAGTETVPLTSTNQIAAHNHSLHVQSQGLGQAPADFSTAPNTYGLSYASRYWYNLSKRPAVSHVGYHPAQSAMGTTVPTTPVQMASNTLSPLSGVGQAHENRQPFVVLRPAICWNGYFAPKP